MKIGKYISELLFEKDFVILPGFGEFSTKYIPARFVPELKKVEKPSKIISFSDRRKNDDNVLSDYIAKKENIEPEKAKSFINAFVKEMNETLKTGKSVELENVGKFSPGVGGSMTFEPDKTINYLKDSLGMSSVKEPEKKPGDDAKPAASQPVEKPKEKEPEKEETAKPAPVGMTATTIKPESDKTEDKKPGTEKPFEKKDPLFPPDKAPVTGIKPPDKKPMPPLTTKPQKKEEPSLSPAMKWIAFVAIPLLVIIIVFAFNFKYILGTDAPGKESMSIVERVKSIFTETEIPEAPVPSPRVVKDAADAATDPLFAEAETRRPAHEPEPGRTVYHIVVGSFVERHNAEIYAEDLRKRGAPRASLFEQARTGHFRVSYGFYYTMQEAEREMQTVKQTVNKDAWILKR